MKIKLPDSDGKLSDYQLQGTPIAPTPIAKDASRVVFSAAHVVSDPFTANDPTGPSVLDWELEQGSQAGIHLQHKKS